MTALLFSPDEIFGHVVENNDASPSGAVYRDDGTPVDFAQPRSCFGCKLKCKNGEHDPCIANLPGTRNACCGHGLDRSPRSGQPNGYVALEDGRSIRFLGNIGAERIRAAVDAALAGEQLPEGFAFDEGKPWWTGLTEAQKAHVQSRIPAALGAMVLKITGRPPSDAFTRGEAMWWDGLSEDEKKSVWSQLGEMTLALADEARRNVAQ